MTIDFDEIIDRRNTHSNKWDEMEKNYGVSADTGIPLWVADMDFRAPQAVNDALQDMATHGVHGYYGVDTTFRLALCGWMKRRHGWHVESDWALQTHGLGNAIAVIIQALSAPGEGVIVFSPVYHSFMRIIKANDRRVVASPLTLNDGRFDMDLDGLQDILTGDERIMLFCSPHNPGGRVWSKNEIAEVAAFCERNDIILVSDEVHHDLVMPGRQHHITDMVAPEIRHRLITLAAASKTFNIAGMETGSMLIADPDLRHTVFRQCRAVNISPNRFGMMMAEAAYTSGDEWLESLIPYLDGNRQLLNRSIEAIPGLTVMDLEATYLAWVDFTSTGMGREEFTKRVREAGLAPSDGITFGPEGENFMRFNIACRRAVLEDAMNRLAAAFSDLQ